MLQLVLSVVVGVASQGASLLAQNATVALVLQIVEALAFTLVAPTSLDKVLEALTAVAAGIVELETASEEVLFADGLVVVAPAGEESLLEVFKSVAVACRELLYWENMLVMPVIFQSSQAEGAGVCVAEMFVPVPFDQKIDKEAMVLRDDDVFEEDPVPLGLAPVVSAPEASEVELEFHEVEVLEEFP